MRHWQGWGLDRREAAGVDEVRTHPLCRHTRLSLDAMPSYPIAGSAGDASGTLEKVNLRSTKGSTRTLLSCAVTPEASCGVCRPGCLLINK